MMSSVRIGGRGERRRRNGRDGGREEGRERESQIKKKTNCFYTTIILEAYQHRSCFPGRGEESIVQRSLASPEISSREQSRRWAQQFQLWTICTWYTSSPTDGAKVLLGHASPEIEEGKRFTFSCCLEINVMSHTLIFPWYQGWHIIAM